MRRQPPRATRTDTLVPPTTRLRSAGAADLETPARRAGTDPDDRRLSAGDELVAAALRPRPQSKGGARPLSMCGRERPVRLGAAWAVAGGGRPCLSAMVPPGEDRSRTGAAAPHVHDPVGAAVAARLGQRSEEHTPE